MHIVKRKGTAHEGILKLASIPGGLESIITPHLRKPSVIVSARKECESCESVKVRTEPEDACCRCSFSATDP